MPLAAQPKLLRAIQEGRFYRVGGTETMHVDVRLVAATNRDLREEVRTGRFREDLFYRLHVVPIHAARRCASGPRTSRSWRASSSSASPRSCSAPVTGIDPPAMDALRAHTWPGNIRELENAIERAITPLRRRDAAGPRPPARALRRARARRPVRRSHAAARAHPRRHPAHRARRDPRSPAPDRRQRHARRARSSASRRRGLQLKMKELEIDREQRRRAAEFAGGSRRAARRRLLAETASATPSTPFLRSDPLPQPLRDLRRNELRHVGAEASRARAPATRTRRTSARSSSGRRSRSRGTCGCSSAPSRTRTRSRRARAARGSRSARRSARR